MAANSEITDNSIMNFGIHKGLKMANVPASYLLFLYDNGKCFGELKKYIERNLDVLRSEVD